MNLREKKRGSRETAEEYPATHGSRERNCTEIVVHTREEKREKQPQSRKETNPAISMADFAEREGKKRKRELLSSTPTTGLKPKGRKDRTGVPRYHEWNFIFDVAKEKGERKGDEPCQNIAEARKKREKIPPRPNASTATIEEKKKKKKQKKRKPKPEMPGMASGSTARGN